MSQPCAGVNTETGAHYHGTEWGGPSYDNHHLFEMFILERAQAGLSWSTLLNKGAGYPAALANFNVDQLVCFIEKQIDQLILNCNSVRNRAKIAAATHNARAIQKIRIEHGPLANFLWSFVASRSIQNTWLSYRDASTSTNISHALNKTLKHYGCKFVGPTICSALEQTIRVINDHERNDMRHADGAALAPNPGARKEISAVPSDTTDHNLWWNCSGKASEKSAPIKQQKVLTQHPALARAQKPTYLVKLFRQHLAAQALMQAFHGSGFFTLPHSRRLLIGLTLAQLGDQPIFFNRAPKAADCYFKWLIFF